jgi:predicted  nucleic acid-binding Zn-ribbon protein
MDVERTMEFILQMQAKLEANFARHEANFARHEVRLSRIDRRIDGITKLIRTGMKAIMKTNQTLDQLGKRTDAKFAELAEVQKRTDSKFAELADAQKQTQASLKAFLGSMRKGRNGR